jgi:signal transduction histidine kinase/ligand-binding sensor domain-containing protein
LHLSSVARRSPFVYRSAVALLASSFVFFGSPSHALDLPKHISQYGHTAWRLEDGYFQSSPQTIAQTADGYLWFGTQAGALRFDGIRFVKLLAPTDKALSSDVVALLGASDGSLWLGTGHGLARSYKGNVTLYPKVTGRIDGVIEDHAHRIWAVQARNYDQGALCEVTEDTAICHGSSEGIASRYAVAVTEATDHSLWVAHSDTLSHWTGERATTIHIAALEHLRGLSGLRVTLANDDGSVWIGMSTTGSGLGLQREMDGHLSPLRCLGFDSERISATALIHDREGALWIGTESDGLYRVKDGVADHYRSVDGLSSDAIYSLFEDKEGNVWAATSSGIDRFRDMRVTSFSLRDGLGAGNPRSVLATRGGTVWVGNQGSLDRVSGDHVTSIRRESGLPGENVTSMVEDRSGLLWVGVDTSLATYDGRTFSLILGPLGESLGIVRSIVQDSHTEDMYAVVIANSQEHVLRIRDRHVINDHLVPHAMQLSGDPAGGVLVSSAGSPDRHWDGLHLDSVAATVGPSDIAPAIFVDADGTTWGASEHGLIGRRAGKRLVLNPTRGLPCATVDTVLKDEKGDFWVRTPCGLVVISATEVREAWNDPNHAVAVRTLTVFDGFFSGTSTFNPKMSLGADGRIWSVNGQVVQVIDPASLKLNDFQPPVHIEQVVADLIPYASVRRVSLPAHTHNLEFDYTGLSFSIPQTLKFRYRLNGYEQTWQEAGTRREAFYTNLGPGRYVFEVVASNSDGVWSEKGASTTVFIAPAFYQTTWFPLVAIAICLFFFYLIYLARLRFVTAQMQVRMLERLGERERIARDLHDTFFQSIQGLFLRFNTGTAQLRRDDPVRAVFTQTLEESDRAMLEGRQLLLDLRATMDTAELAALFAQAGEDLQEIHPAVFKVTVLGQSRPLHPQTATEIYRIGKEALHNAFTHSCASHIEIELEYATDALKLRVRDDGGGIDEKIIEDGMRKGHWGLPGMQERATKIGGNLNVWSRKDEGTEIEISVPSADAYLVPNAKLFPAWMHRLVGRVLTIAEQPNV